MESKHLVHEQEPEEQETVDLFNLYDDQRDVIMLRGLALPL